MALLSPQPLTSDGFDPTDGDPADLDGDSFTNTGRELFAVGNFSGGAIDVTVETSITVDGQDADDLVVTLQDGVSRVMGPFSPAVYGTQVNVSYSGNTNAFVRVLKFPR
jgi:hypothetical protein